MRKQARPLGRGGGGFRIFPSPYIESPLLISRAFVPLPMVESLTYLSSWVYLLAHPISQPGVEHLKVLISRAPSPY